MDDTDECGGLISVLLVYAHTLIRSGLAVELEAAADIEVIGESPDAESALACVASTSPGVVVTDFLLPGMGGCALARHVLDKEFASEVVLLVDRADPEMVRAALHSGAMGVIDKHSELDCLGDAIRMAATSTVYLCPSSATALATDVRPVSDDIVDARMHNRDELHTGGKTWPSSWTKPSNSGRSGA